jgi:hypothetical protein
LYKNVSVQGSLRRRVFPLTTKPFPNSVEQPEKPDKGVDKQQKDDKECQTSEKEEDDRDIKGSLSLKEPIERDGVIRFVD